MIFNHHQRLWRLSALVILTLLFASCGMNGDDSADTAIFYSPHPDDETLSMGASIARHVREGYDTHVVLLTQGAASVAIDSVNDRLAEEGREPLTIEQFKAARVLEFKLAVSHLGVNEENIHIYDFDDANLRQEDVKSVMRDFEAQFPGAKHHAFTYDDPHPDHAATGQALRELLQDDKVTYALYYVPRYVDMEEVGRLTDVSEIDTANVLEALEAYNLWDPDDGYYAIGYHSIARAMEQMANDPRNRVHE